MGLDMYFVRQYTIDSGNGLSQIQDILKNNEISLAKIEYPSLYWRKFFPLHEWIVRNMQGIPSSTYYLDDTDLVCLLEAITAQLKYPYAQILPGYDESYNDMLLLAKDEITAELEFYRQSNKTIPYNLHYEFEA